MQQLTSEGRRQGERFKVVTFLVTFLLVFFLMVSCKPFLQHYSIIGHSLNGDIREPVRFYPCDT